MDEWVGADRVTKPPSVAKAEGERGDRRAGEKAQKDGSQRGTNGDRLSERYLHLPREISTVSTAREYRRAKTLRKYRKTPLPQSRLFALEQAPPRIFFRAPRD